MLAHDYVQAFMCINFVGLLLSMTNLPKKHFFFEMLLFLITVLKIFVLYFTDLPSTLWLNLFSACDFVVRYADLIEVHYIVQ